jgi:predicted ATP-grasp superfamily ATP-dependent carboligase
MVYADQLDEINNSVLSGMLDPQAARLVSDNKKWQASRLIPKVYGDRMGIESKVEAGDSFIKVLQQVNDAARLKHAEVIDGESIQPQSLRAGEDVNPISVNDEMPKK